MPTLQTLCITGKLEWREPIERLKVPAEICALKPVSWYATFAWPVQGFRGTVKLDLNATTISFVSDVNCCVLPTLLPQNLKCNSSSYSASFYCPQTKLRGGNVFAPVCDSVHRGKCMAEGACMVGGVCGAEGVCGTEGGVNGRGRAW